MEILKFSVSMCVYYKDNPEWFSTAVESILNQSLKPNEIVLVVDGPVPDELEAIIIAYETVPIFKVVRLATNQGHGNARRIGLENCTYELIALMDADDICMPDRFEKQVSFFKSSSDLSIVGGQVTKFYDDPCTPFSKREVPVTDKKIKEYMKYWCPMNQPTVMFKKSDVISVGGYMDWYCNEDYYLWLRLLLANKVFANSDSILVKMRTTPDSYQRRGGWKYFRSEAKLQKYMFSNKVIGVGTFFINVSERFIIQVLMPNRLRGWVFRILARKPSV